MENHRQHCRLCRHASNNFWRWKLQRVLCAVPHCPRHGMRKVWLCSDTRPTGSLEDITIFIIHTNDEWARLTTGDDPLLITRYFSSLHFPSPVTVKQMITRGIAKMWHTFLLANWSDRSWNEWKSFEFEKLSSVITIVRQRSIFITRISDEVTQECWWKDSECSRMPEH